MNKIARRERNKSKILCIYDKSFFSTIFRKDGLTFKRHIINSFDKDNIKKRTIDRFINSYFIHSINFCNEGLDISSHNNESINYGLKIRTHIDKRFISHIYNKYYEDRKLFIDGLSNNENIYINSSDDLTNYYRPFNKVHFNLKSRKELKPADWISKKLEPMEEEFLYSIFDYVFQDKSISINASDNDILMVNQNNRMVSVNKGLENYVKKYLKMHNEKIEHEKNSKVLQLKMEGI